MRIYIPQNSIRTLAVILFLLFGVSLLFAQVPGVSATPQMNKGRMSSPAQKDLSMVQEEARKYRSQGLEQQNIGNLDAAMSLYQKAIELDPTYAVAYNDLGVIYEANGFIDRAEDSYKKAITIDPDYLSAYSNLALLYENKGQIDKAILYWRKRADLGSAQDPWTKKAKSRYNELMRITPSFKQALIEQEIAELNKIVLERKRIKKQAALNEAKKHLKLAKKLYDNADYRKALEELKVTTSLNPQDQEALSMMEMVKSNIAQQEKREREERKKNDIKDMQWHFESGIKYYQEDNLQAAKEEFAKVKELIASPQKK